MDDRQGVEHVVVPEQGFILLGMAVATGDSHTTTHGTLGVFDIGTSEIEHLLATETLVYKRLKTMRVTVNGEFPLGPAFKDSIILLIAKIGASGATGFSVEFSGLTITVI